MNREEAHKEARIGGQTRDLTIFDVDVIIDKIYDDFENKTCQSCKYGKFGVDSMGIEVECSLNWDCSRARIDRWESI